MSPQVKLIRCVMLGSSWVMQFPMNIVSANKATPVHISLTIISYSTPHHSYLFYLQENK